MRPNVDQLESIRRLSDVVYGHPGMAFKQHGMPETREEASALLRRLHSERKYDSESADIEPEEETMETRTCAECGAVKPIDEFRKFGRGRMTKCMDCDHLKSRDDPGSERNREKVAASVSGTEETAAEPVDHFAFAADEKGPEIDEGPHWCVSELRDPRLSTLEQIVDGLNAYFFGDDNTRVADLEDAAGVAKIYAELDLA